MSSISATVANEQIQQTRDDCDTIADRIASLPAGDERERLERLLGQQHYRLQYLETMAVPPVYDVHGLNIILLREGFMGTILYLVFKSDEILDARTLIAQAYPSSNPYSSMEKALGTDGARKMAAQQCRFPQYVEDSYTPKGVQAALDYLWVMEGRSSILPFPLCCELLGIDPQAVRKRVEHVCSMPTEDLVLMYEGLSAVANAERPEDDTEAPAVP